MWKTRAISPMHVPSDTHIIQFVANAPKPPSLCSVLCALSNHAHTPVGVRDQALQPTGKPNPQWLPMGLQPPYVPVPFLDPPPVHWW